MNAVNLMNAVKAHKHTQINAKLILLCLWCSDFGPQYPVSLKHTLLQIGLQNKQKKRSKVINKQTNRCETNIFIFFFLSMLSCFYP